MTANQSPRQTIGSEYLCWVKTRKPARFYLAGSGVQPCSLADLRADAGQLEINGPSLYSGPLQEAIAAHCRVASECVVTAAGASMANFLVMAALINPGDEVVIEEPVYEPLPALAAYFGGRIRRWPRGTGVRDAISDRTRLIVATNLHNPTCEQLNQEQLQELAAAAGNAGARVLVDEVYLECMYENRSSAFHLGPQFVCTGSLTKAYGLGGLRCGWILADPDLAWRIRRLKDLTDPGSPYAMEQLSVAAFRNLELLAVRAKALIRTNRSALLKWLTSRPQVTVSTPQYGTCVAARLNSGEADRFCDLLREEYDADVVPGRFFGMPNHFRIGIGGDPELFAAGLERLGAALERMS